MGFGVRPCYTCLDVVEYLPEKSGQFPPTTALTLELLFSKCGLRRSSVHGVMKGSREHETGWGVFISFLINCIDPMTSALKSKGIWRLVQLMRRAFWKMRHKVPACFCGVFAQFGSPGLYVTWFCLYMSIQQLW